MPANPGKMDRRLTVQVKSSAKDAAGGRTETWVDSFKVWGEQLSQRATEGVLSDSERNSDNRVFRIRYHTTIQAGIHRIYYNSEFYDITGITEEGIKDRMLVTCRSLKSLTT